MDEYEVLVWISILSGLDNVLVLARCPLDEGGWRPWVPLRSRMDSGAAGGGGGEPAAAAVSLAVELRSLGLLKMEYQHPAHMSSW